MPSPDYDGFLSATLSITRDMRDVEAVFRRMVFNILAHNRDDHVRLHAFLMDDKGQCDLAPVFDLTFSNCPGGENYMAVAGEGRAITRAHVQTLGLRHGILPRRITSIIDEVRAAVTDWAGVSKDVGVGVSKIQIGKLLAQIDQEFGMGN